MGVTTVIKAIERFLERRPWCIAGVYLLMESLKYLALAILFTNHCPSSLRFVPELSDEFAAWVSDVYDFSLKAAAVVGAVMLVVPLFFLAIRNARKTALRVFGFGIVTIVFSIVLAFMVAPIVYVGSMELGLAEQENDESEEIRDWTNSTECGSRNDYQYPKTRYQFVAHEENKGVYDLFDRRVRRVVVKDVVRWEERDERLRFVTRDGARYFIAYWEGRIRRYPDPECVHSKSKKDDAIFERLELR